MSSVVAMYSDGIYLDGLTFAQKRELTERLTFDNPACAQALRFSPYERVYVPPTLCYAEETKNGFRVPLGFKDPIIDLAKKIDWRVYNVVDYPEFKYKLRNVQKEATDAYFEQNTGFNINALCCLRTGSGKSSLALFIAQALRQRTLIVCHKLDLVDQFRDEAIRAFGGKLSIGEYHGKKKTQGEHITIASLQTLARLDETAKADFVNNYGLLVTDECHIAAASTFSFVNQSKARYKLGITATPERNDGLTHLLYSFFGGLCYYEDKRKATDVILPVEVLYRGVSACVLPIMRKSVAGYSLSRYATSRRITLRRDVDSEEMSIYDVPHAQRPNVDAFKIDELFLKQAWSAILDDVLREYCEGHSCLVMFKQKKHVDAFAEALDEYVDDEDKDIEFVKYYGDNPDCASALGRARSQRKLITIATYSKVTEGTDCKQWEVAFIASSIGNGKNTEQAVGRIRRSCDTPKLARAKVYDYRASDVYTYTTQAKRRDERYAQLGFTIVRNK